MTDKRETGEDSKQKIAGDEGPDLPNLKNLYLRCLLLKRECFGQPPKPSRRGDCSPDIRAIRGSVVDALPLPSYARAPAVLGCEITRGELSPRKGVSPESGIPSELFQLG